MWRLRIWFMDNIWDRIFPADETQKLVMGPGELCLIRKQFGISVGAMAKMLCVSVQTYKNWEHHGLHAPDDIEGSSVVVIILILRMQERIRECNEILGMLGYKGK